MVTGAAIGPIVRPLAKIAVKAGLAAYDQGRVAVAELTEHAGGIDASGSTEPKVGGNRPRSRERRYRRVQCGRDCVCAAL